MLYIENHLKRTYQYIIYASYASKMLHPLQTASILNALPICSDIQFNILMMFIGASGTPSSNVVRKPIDDMIAFFSHPRIKFNAYKLYTLTSFRVDLSLFNFKSHILNENEEEDQDDGEDQEDDVGFHFPEFIYDVALAYSSYFTTEDAEYNAHNESCLKNAVKFRLQKMIQEEPVVAKEEESV
jgi:hypothetical protein